MTGMAPTSTSSGPPATGSGLPAATAAATVAPAAVSVSLRSGDGDGGDDDALDLAEEQLQYSHQQHYLNRQQPQGQGLQGLQGHGQGQQDFGLNPQQQGQDSAAARKRLSRAHDAVLKHLLRMIETGTARAFVYGIIPAAQGCRPVGGSSENLRAWWKERVRFDKNGPAALALHNAEVAAAGGFAGEGGAGVGVNARLPLSSLLELQDTTLGSLLSALMQVRQHDEISGFVAHCAASMALLSSSAVRVRL